MKKVLIVLLMIIILTGCSNNDVEFIDDYNESINSTTTTIRPTSSTTTSTTPTTATSSTTTTTNIVIENEYLSTVDNMKHAYTYTYDYYGRCRAEGNRYIESVSKILGIKVNKYDCDKIIDNNGKEKYGIYFYNSSNPLEKIYY